MTVECPRCGKAYRVGDDKAGKRMKCKACDAVVTIPDVDFLADDPDVEEIDDIDDFAMPGRSRRRGEKTSTRRKGKAKGKAKREGWSSPKVQYAGGAAIVVATVGVVLFILQQRGFFRDEDKESVDDGPSSRPVSNQYKYGFGFAFSGPVECSRSPATRFPASYKLTVGKLGEEPAFTRTERVSEGPLPAHLRKAAAAKLKVAPATGREAAQLAAEKDQLRSLAAAIYLYHVKHKQLPAPVLPERGLSWRVHLLPFLGEQKLYDEFKLDEPWDSAHNKTLIPRMPAAFKTASATRPGTTSVHMFVGPGTPMGLPKPAVASSTYQCKVGYQLQTKAIDPEATYVFSLEVFNSGGPAFKPIVHKKEMSGRELLAQPKLEWKFDVPIVADNYRPTRIRDLLDGVPNTVLFAVAGPETAAEWTRPGGLNFVPGNPFPVLGTVSANGFSVVMFDGRVVTVPIHTAGHEFTAVVGHQDGILVRAFPPPPPPTSTP